MRFLVLIMAVLGLLLPPPMAVVACEAHYNFMHNLTDSYPGDCHSAMVSTVTKIPAAASESSFVVNRTNTQTNVKSRNITRCLPEVRCRNWIHSVG